MIMGRGVKILQFFKRKLSTPSLSYCIKQQNLHKLAPMKTHTVGIIAVALLLIDSPFALKADDKKGEPGNEIVRIRAAAQGTTLGIAMDQIPVLTRAQLGLPEGIGIAVAHVAKGSAAEKAGLKVNDIITQLDDQLIINSQQLQTLIHTKKPGDEVTITYLRKGKEHKATAKLTKGPIVVHAPQALRLENGQWQQFNLPNGLGQGQLRMFKLNPQNLDQLNEQLKNIPGINPEELKKLFEGQGLNFGPGAPNGPGGNEFKFHFNFPGGNQGGQGDNAPNIPNIRKQVMTSITISDNTGAYTLTTKNGKKTFTAKDPDGAESFTGPVDTKKQRDSLDRDLIKKLEQLEGMGAGKGGIQLNRLNLNGGNFKFDKKFEFKIDPRQPVPKKAPKKPRSDA
jgi:hypothetical protein